MKFKRFKKFWENSNDKVMTSNNLESIAPYEKPYWTGGVRGFNKHVDGIILGNSEDFLSKKQLKPIEYYDQEPIDNNLLRKIKEWINIPELKIDRMEDNIIKHEPELGLHNHEWLIDPNENHKDLCKKVKDWLDVPEINIFKNKYIDEISIKSLIDLFSIEPRKENEINEDINKEINNVLSKYKMKNEMNSNEIVIERLLDALNTSEDDYYTTSARVSKEDKYVMYLDLNKNGKTYFGVYNDGDELSKVIEDAQELFIKMISEHYQNTQIKKYVKYQEELLNSWEITEEDNEKIKDILNSEVKTTYEPKYDGEEKIDLSDDNEQNSKIIVSSEPRWITTESTNPNDLNTSGYSIWQGPHIESRIGTNPPAKQEMEIGLQILRTVEVIIEKLKENGTVSINIDLE